mgnify:CR=1 FL=1
MKIIAVDIGGTAVKSGLMDGESFGGCGKPPPYGKGGRAVMALVREIIASYGPEAPTASASAPRVWWTAKQAPLCSPRTASGTIPAPR